MWATGCIARVCPCGLEGQGQQRQGKGRLGNVNSVECLLPMHAAPLIPNTAIIQTTGGGSCLESQHWESTGKARRSRSSLATQQLHEHPELHETPSLMRK